MADLVVGNVSALFVCGITDIRAKVAGQGGVGFGQAVYFDPATGQALPTDARTASKTKFRGIMTGQSAGVGLGQAFNCLERGYVAGFDLSALAYDDLIYLSDTPGKLSSTPGTTSVVVGRVDSFTDTDSVTGLPSKMLFIRPTPV